MTHARRKQAIAGVVGLAALGAGAYLVTDQLTGAEPKAAFVAPAAVPSAPSTGASPPAAPPAAAAAEAPPEKKVTTTTKTREQQIDEVRGAAAKAAKEVERPVTSMRVTAANVAVKKIPLSSGVLQVFSAREDLTGKRELAWVQGQKGAKVGSSNCTQSITLAEGVPPRKRDTLLICWRVSAAKSVYTIATDPKGKPPVARSVAELDKVWSALR